MVLSVLATAVTAVLPSNYYVHALVAIVTILAIRAFAQGRSTNRERDLHARVVLVTGGFTPMGLTLLRELAGRGAHIIALSPVPIESPKIDILINLLRSTTNNEQIFADECDLTSPNSVHDFCTKFLTGQEHRLDAIIFAHEYQHICSFFSYGSTEDLEKERQEASLATFLATTLLLPALLVAPVERDIRIINVINPFYAAAVPSFSPSFDALPLSSSMFLQEGRRALRMAVFTRHLQRVLDALPSGGQVPKTDDNTNTIPVVSEKSQKSNIVAVSVCPGISRSDTIAPLLASDLSTRGFSTTGTIIYYLLQPILRVLVKSPNAALQSILHVLFLPTPFKASPAKPAAATGPIENDTLPEEILKPGALYRECAVVHLHVPSPPDPFKDIPMSNKGKGKENEGGSGQGLADDGELGGEVAGRLVWESFEKALKEWEKTNPPPKKDRSTTPPSVDTPTD